MQQRPISRRTFLKLFGGAALSAPFAGAGAFAYSSEIEPGWIDLTSVELRLPRLGRAFDGFRLAQISDIHMGDWMTLEHLVHVVDLINGLQADAVAITGDFVSYRNRTYAEQLKTALGMLNAPTYAVPGNHDHWGWIPVFYEVMQAANIMPLSNATHTLQRGNEQLHIAGVDDVWMRKAMLSAVTAKLPNTGAVVLLAHEPDFADRSAATGRIDLQISGHSHGGQVNLPFIGPPILPYLGRKYPQGLYQVEGMYQYTNRGIGMVPPTVRFNCRPEITLFTLRAPAAG